jgi:amino acid permease
LYVANLFTDNAPTFYKSLRDANAQRFGTVTSVSFAVLILLYIIAMTMGYATFGDASQGNILLNYHTKDTLARVARLATGCSILFGYPLVVMGARQAIQGIMADTSSGHSVQGMMDTLRVTIQGLADSRFGFPIQDISDRLRSTIFFRRICRDMPATAHVPLVLCILLVSSILACAVPHEALAIVLSLIGAIVGSFIVYACPALIYTEAVAICKGRDSAEHAKAKLWNKFALIPFGLFTAAFGVYMTLHETVAAARG